MDYYGTVEGFLAYCEENGYDVEDLEPSPPEDTEIILRRGTTYIDGKYRARFPGKKTDGRAQILEWPRTDARDVAGDELPDDEVPREVVAATYEAALREYNEPGSLAPDYVATERVRSESVGPLSVTYATNTTISAADAMPVISLIDMILAPLLIPASKFSMFGEVSR